MDAETDYRTTGLGQVLNYRELRNRCRSIWGGVSWPGKRPGLAIVVAMENMPHFDSHDIFLLDEYESFDTRQFVRQIGAFDLKYGIMMNKIYTPDSLDKWIGDNMNDAASRFIQTMNEEHVRANCRFSLNSTLMLEMESLYPYILPQIKELLSADRRTLYLKDSKIVNYLSEIEETEISELKFGEYPAIEAVAFAVIEMRRQVAAKERTANIPVGDVCGNSQNLLDFGRDRDPIWA